MTSFDVVVIWGGPAGATAATTAAMDGRRVLLLERERFPRYHVGESLLPATVQGICRFLGVGPALERAGFVRKHGASFQWQNGSPMWHLAFGEATLQPGVKSVYAYQVRRSVFDRILLRNARAKGVIVKQGCQATEIVFEAGRAVAVRYRARTSGAARTAPCSYVVDASGQRGVLRDRIGTREDDQFFRNLAVFGYYRGGGRLRGRRRGNVLSAAFDKGWIWHIPISDRITSVGAVVGRDEGEQIRRRGPRRALAGYIDGCMPVRDLLGAATPITRGEFGRTRVIQDYSYVTTPTWAPGAVLVGDAAVFLDPLFASGVHLATYSGVYPGFPTLFWGLSGFCVGDLMGKALWKLVENAARFPRRGGRVLCVHGAVSFHRARPCGPRWLPGRGAMRHVELDRRVLGLQSTGE